MRSALRLRRPADFARVQRRGAVYRHPDLSLGVRKNDLSHNRYGIVAGRRVGKAVIRNRCKRRLRAVLNCLHASLHQGFDVVVVARPVNAWQPFSELQRILRELCLRARLIGNR